MSKPSWLLPLGASALALSMACGGGGFGPPPEAQITIQARYEKRPLTPSGLGAPVNRPARVLLG